MGSAVCILPKPAHLFASAGDAFLKLCPPIYNKIETLSPLLSVSIFNYFNGTGFNHDFNSTDFVFF